MVKFTLDDLWAKMEHLMGKGSFCISMYKSPNGAVYLLYRVTPGGNVPLLDTDGQPLFVSDHQTLGEVEKEIKEALHEVSRR